MHYEMTARPFSPSVPRKHLIPPLQGVAPTYTTPASRKLEKISYTAQDAVDMLTVIANFKVPSKQTLD